MATRFGGVSKNQQQRHIKTMLVFCFVLILVLLGSLFFLVQSPSQQPQVQPAVAVTPVQPLASQASSDSVRILVSRQRIEQGAALNPQMFEPRDWDPNNVPPGAVLENKLETMIAERPYYAAHLIAAHVPLVETSVTDTKPLSAIDIPPGHRAVTITVDARSGVEGWAKPDSRVDVLWTHVGKDGRKRVTTLVPYAKILSVGGATASQAKAAVGANTTVTLLVTVQQAKKIELARTIGDLSLSLVGDIETVGEVDDGDQITLEDLLGSDGVDRDEEIPADGVMYDVDPVTGKRRRYLLVNGRWKLDAEE